MSRNFEFRMLNDEQCKQIVQKVTEILSTVGCIVQNKAAKDLLLRGGCYIENDRIKIPENLLTAAIKSTPKEIKLYNRFGEEAMTIKEDSVYYGPHLGCPNTVDLETGEIRPYAEQDAVHFAKVCDALPNISWAAAAGQINDVDPKIADLRESRAVMTNTSKVFTTWATTSKNLKTILEMNEVILGSRKQLEEKPNLFLGMCPMNSLTHGDNELDIFLYAVERHIPVIYTPGMMLGIQTPATVAAGILLGICDTLTALVISQLKQKGAPFMAANFMSSCNMKTLALTVTDTEGSIANLACADIFRYLHLPFCSHAGGTDANSFDQQAAGDVAIQLYSAMLGGCNLVVHLGYLSCAMVSSLEELAYGDEIISMLRCIEKGVEINEDTLAMDTIKELGPGGNYLNTEHTLDNYRKLWTPNFFSRDNQIKWEKEGKPDLKKRLNDYIKDVISKEQKHPLSEDVLDKIDSILQKAEEEILC